MSEIKNQIYCTFHDAPAHRFPGHPESPNRIQNLKEWLDAPPYTGIRWLVFDPAGEADLVLVHPPALLEWLKMASQQGAHEFEPSPSYVTKGSYQAALGAVGAVLAVSRKIISVGKGRGFAIIRPPGHHAEPERSMGFCLLNNIAIAAADAIASGLQRVAIVDFDAHHGNGTEAAFWNTPEVGYLSIHEGNMYPGSGHIESAPHARGRIINVPVPAFSGNIALKNVIDHVIEPWLSDFRADMLFVSAGFDAHFSDPLTTLTLDTSGFYQMAQGLVRIADQHCDGKILFALEGGYDPVALKDNIQACLAAMGGHEGYSDHYGEAPVTRPDVDSIIRKLVKLHELKEK